MRKGDRQGLCIKATQMPNKPESHMMDSVGVRPQCWAPSGLQTLAPHILVTHGVNAENTLTSQRIPGQPCFQEPGVV